MTVGEQRDGDLKPGLGHEQPSERLLPRVHLAVQERAQRDNAVHLADHGGVQDRLGAGQALEQQVPADGERRRVQPNKGRLRDLRDSREPRSAEAIGARDLVCSESSGEQEHHRGGA